MNPMFFGSTDHRLYGVYHQPALGRGRKGVVLCYPWGQEYMRAHRTFRFLGESLAQAGVHVLRFDYWGTGDSDGDLCGGDTPTWLADIRLAVRELMDIADLQKVSLCGLRVGAHWAARCAIDARNVGGVVLWDPVVDGGAYVDELLASSESTERGLPEVDGFVLTDAVRNELAAASLQDFLDLPGPSLVLRTTTVPEVDPLAPALAVESGRMVHKYTPEPPAWKEEIGDFGTSGMPVATLKEITEWLASS